MSQTLYRKWRPKTWEEIVGQEHVVQTLKNAVSSDRVVHAYLFAGPRGTGKTSTARILAKAVNCLAEEAAERPCNTCEYCQAINEGRFLDLIEIDAASNTSVDDVRDLRDKINFSPNQGRFKVYIIDEVHMLSTAAFNALLKTLEEPPSHAIFILATTEVHKIPATVLSRCQRHEFRRIPVREIVAQLERMTKAEGIKADNAVLTFLARQATGSMRDAISLLDQLASMGGKITLEEARKVLGTADSEKVLRLVDALLAGAATEGMAILRETLDAGSDARQFAKQVVDYLRGLLLIKSGNADQVDETTDVRAQMALQASKIESKTLLEIIRIFTKAGSEARNSWQPTLPMEMAVVESALMIKEPGEQIEEKAGVVEKRTAKAQPKADKTAAVKTKTAEEADKSKPKIKTDPLPDNIKRNWVKIRQKAREEDPITQALLNSCTPMGVYKGALILAFTSDVLRTKMEQGDHLENTRKAIKEVTGELIDVRCVTAASERSKIPDDVEQDGLVATAVRDLGAEVVDNQ